MSFLVARSQERLCREGRDKLIRLLLIYCSCKLKFYFYRICENVKCENKTWVSILKGKDAVLFRVVRHWNWKSLLSATWQRIRGNFKWQICNKYHSYLGRGNTLSCNVRLSHVNSENIPSDFISFWIELLITDTRWGEHMRKFCMWSFRSGLQNSTLRRKIQNIEYAARDPIRSVDSINITLYL